MGNSTHIMIFAALVINVPAVFGLTRAIMEFWDMELSKYWYIAFSGSTAHCVSGR